MNNKFLLLASTALVILGGGISVANADTGTTITIKSDNTVINSTGADVSIDASQLGQIATNASNISTLQGTVGNSTSGLVKDVSDNASAISTINNSDVMKSGINSTKVTQIGTNKTSIGTLTSLSTTAQTDLVSAINEVDGDVSTLQGKTTGISYDSSSTTTTVTGKLTSTDKLTVSSGGANITGDTSVTGTLGVSSDVTVGNTSGKQVVLGTTNGTVVADGDIKGGSFTIGSNSVTSIDTGASAVTSGSNEALATTATVLKSGENATYTGTKVSGATTSTTLSSALGETNTTLNNVLTDDGKEVASAKVDVQWNSIDSTLSTTLGNGQYGTTVYNVVNGDSLTTTIGAIDAAIGNRADWSKNDAGTALTVGTALTNSSSVTDAISQLNVNVGTATQLTSSNNIATTNTVNQNINALDANLGKVADVTVKGYNPTSPATKNLTGAVNQLDTNMGAVLGGIYKADGSYDNTVLANNGLETGTTSLSNAINEYAANVAAATGTTYAEDGGFTNSYNNNTAVSYDAIANTTSLVGAISQVASNVGTAAQLITSGVNGVSDEYSVNANINAVNTILGNVATLDGNSLNNGTENQPTTVVEALQNIDATLGTIHGLAKELGDDYNGNLAEGTTVSEHLTAIDGSIGDRRDIQSANGAINAGTKTSVAEGLKATGDTIGSADFGSTHYAKGANNLTDAIKNVDTKLYNLNNEVIDLRDELRKGMASQAAMSALVPNARAYGNTQVAIGTGAYRGNTAAALGAFHWVNDNLLLNAGVGYAGSSSATYRMGVTISW